MCSFYAKNQLDLFRHFDTIPAHEEKIGRRDMHKSSGKHKEQEGLAVASIARDVGSSRTNCSSDIMHFLPRLLKKTLQHQRL